MFNRNILRTFEMVKFYFYNILFGRLFLSGYFMATFAFLISFGQILAQFVWTSFKGILIAFVRWLLQTKMFQAEMFQSFDRNCFKFCDNIMAHPKNLTFLDKIDRLCIFFEKVWQFWKIDISDSYFVMTGQGLKILSADIDFVLLDSDQYWVTYLSAHVGHRL